MAKRRSDRELTAYDLQMTESDDPSSIYEDEKGVLHIDPDMVPDDEVWSWARRTINNMPDATNIHTNIADGWTPILVSDYPQLASGASYLLPDHERDFVIRGDCMLMKMPKALHKKKLEKYARKANLQTQQVDALHAKNREDGGLPHRTYMNESSFSQRY